MNGTITRRKFLTGVTAAAVGGICLPRLRAEDAGGGVIYVVHGKDIARMLNEGIVKCGGWSKFIKPGGKTVLKVNAAWASDPEQGGNTHPELVENCVRACLRAGAAEVVVPEKTCSPFKEAFARSGILDAVKRAGGRMYCPESAAKFRTVAIPQGKKLQQVDVVADVLDADCLINMPVAKNHGGATLTLSMKNWMGSVNDRGYWHRNGLHQCIADFSTFIRPSLVILDAIRIMTTKGPRGPGKLAYPDQLVFGCDPVAVDAYAATLFGKKPFDIPHIAIAHEMGVGCGDLDQIRAHHVHV